MPLGNLPEPAKKLWESIYEDSKKGGDSEEIAARKAWAGVKRGWKKDENDNWVKRSYIEFSTYICKTSFDTKLNKMRWRMTASDTGKDVFDERMSLELFTNFVRRIGDEENVPEQFRSVLREKSGWDGGMPYTSISHYKSGADAANVPGDVEAVYVDGETLKAKGTFRDTDLGRAVFKAVNEDLAGTSKFENPIRVSIGFLDYKHAHGDMVFERKSLEDTCPMCNNGEGNKVYLDGQLVHFAFTRIPANERTDVGLEEKSMADEIKTRKQDAESIVGEKLAEMLEVNKSTTDTDSLLVIKSEEPVVEEAKAVVEDPKEDDEEDMAEDQKACGTKKEKSAAEVAAEDVLTVLASMADLAPEEAQVKLQEKLDALASVAKDALPKVPVKETNPEIEAVRSLVEKSQTDILNAIAGLTEKIETVATEVAVLKSSQEAGKVVSKTVIPEPRSTVVTERTKALQPKRLSQIQRIALQSVGEVVD